MYITFGFGAKTCQAREGFTRGQYCVGAYHQTGEWVSCQQLDYTIEDQLPASQSHREWEGRGLWDLGGLRVCGLPATCPLCIWG